MAGPSGKTSGSLEECAADVGEEFTAGQRAAVEQRHATVPGSHR
ncbi:hypothetical protein [Actinoplanes palleronii]|nr:hypothetical protein [Actinoplanes palleronii]